MTHRPYNDDGHVTAEAEMKCYSWEPRITQITSKPPEGRKSLRREHSPADTLISDFKTLELWDNNFCCFKPLSVWYLVKTTLGNEYTLSGQPKSLWKWPKQAELSQQQDTYRVLTPYTGPEWVKSQARALSYRSSLSIKARMDQARKILRFSTTRVMGESNRSVVSGRPSWEDKTKPMNYILWDPFYSILFLGQNPSQIHTQTSW